MLLVEKKWHPLTLAGVLGIKKREMIAVYGGGGKTTLLNSLARELAQAGKKVILTTTTKIFPPQDIPVVTNPQPSEAWQQLEQLLAYHPIVCLGSALLPQGKLAGMAPDLLVELFKQKFVSHILVEADGSAQKPIKGYASYEPVIPPTAGLILPVIGLDALGARVDEKLVHRPELFSLQSGAEISEYLDIDCFIRCLDFMIRRGVKSAPSARVVPVINKVDLMSDDLDMRAVAMAVQEEVGGVERIIFSATREVSPVKIVLQPGCTRKDPGDSVPATLGTCEPAVSCVVLAAGSGKRMGREKLFLPLGEKTILEHAVDSALQSGAKEVILVTRPRSKKAVSKLFQDKNVRVVTNPRHREGMASSLQAGLAAVNHAAQGVIFALGDQPFVTPAVYDALIKSYHQRWSLITAPLYQGERGNPVLLDRRIWPLVMELEGDTGGRELFSRVAEEKVALLELGTAEVLQDIDTQEDYQRFSPAEKNNNMGK